MHRISVIKVEDGRHQAQIGDTGTSLGNDIHVSSWSELQFRLYQSSWQDDLKRFRSPFAFRGLSNANTSPETTLVRLGGEYQKREQSLLRNFRKYAQNINTQPYSLWNWIALAQHHGLPTRMVDWTWSPLVALHFVTHLITHYEEDGIVVAIDTNRARAFLPGKLKKVIEKEATGVFSIEMLDEVATSLASFDGLHDEEFVAFLDPPSLDARIVNQFAAFSVMNDAGARLDRWLEQHPEVYRMIIVPAELKWEVRDKLDQANVAERTLFPGLDGLCRWLTRYYTPRQIEPVAKRKHIRQKKKP